MSIYFGADPELFVEKADGSLFHAFDFLKDRDNNCYLTEDNNQVYPDGFQAEFNITATPYVLEAVKSIRFGLKAVLERAKQVDPKSKLSSNPVVPVNLEVMKTLPFKYTEFGCKPSFNSYFITGIGGSGPTTPYRFAGGHIHFGDEDLQDKDDETYFKFVRNLDAMLGVACVSLAENIDNPIRRRYYGLPGEHRRPAHGLEYRVLSNFWTYSPALATVILQFAKNILLYTKTNGISGWKAETSEITEAIILSDVKQARKILIRNQGILHGLSSGLDYLKPIEETIPTIRNIEQNWGL